MKFAWLVLAGLGAFWLVRSAATEICQEEVRTRLTRLPNALVRLAVARLPQDARDDLADEWQAELDFVLRDTDGLPLTRLLRGTRYAMGLLWASRGIAHELSRGEEVGSGPDDPAASLLDTVALSPGVIEAVGYRGPIACAAAGITYRQLDYWASTGLVEPSLRTASGSDSLCLYSFRDILVLRVVKRLLDTGISLRQIRTAVHHLRNRGTDDLAHMTLMSDGVALYECTSSEEVVDLLQGGQGIFGIALGRLWQEIDGTLAELPAEPVIRRQD